MMVRKRLFGRMAATLAGVAAGAVIFAGCGGASGTGTGLSAYEISDMSGYAIEELKGDTVFRSMTVKDMEKEMKDKNSFAVYFGFNDCPWCKKVLPTLNEVAKKEGFDVGYVDTRKDPSWSSNLDIDDYDKFVELAGQYLDTDKEGKKHLYVPHVFFIKDGIIVDEHDGVVPGYDSPSDEMTDEQKKELEKVYKECFDKIK